MSNGRILPETVMSTILDLPSEVVEQILLACDAFDLSPFSQTCRRYHSLVYESDTQLVWRSLYLELWDDPRICLRADGTLLAVDAPSYDWKGELQRRIRARTVINNPQYWRSSELSHVLRTLVEMIVCIPPATFQYTAEEVSRNLLWLGSQKSLENFIGHTASPECTQELPDPEEVVQLNARLHTYYGLTKADLNNPVLVDARALVYDMRNYSTRNGWGPFRQDRSGRVNWVHVRAVQQIMSKYLAVVAGPHADVRISPMSLPFCQAQISSIEDGVGGDDWAGIEGSWKCSFCFIDHRDLIGEYMLSIRCSTIFRLI